MAVRKKRAPKKTVKSFPKGLIIVCIAALGVIVVMLLTPKSSTMPPPYQTPSTQVVTSSFDFGNQTYILDSQSLQFVDGSYRSGDRAASITARNVNQDGTRAVAILVDNPGGSGLFYYLVGAMRSDGKDMYSTPVLLGDRIKIVSVSVDDPQTEDNGIITVTYLDRPQDAPMADSPTEEVTRTYAFEDNGNLMLIE